MSKISLIIEREYLTRVQKKSFLIMTFLSPFLIVALVLVPLWLSSIKDNVQEISVIDYTGHYKDAFVNTDSYRFSYLNDPGTTPRQLREQARNDSYTLIVITGNLLENPEAITIYSEKQVNAGLKNHITKNMENFLSEEKMASYNIPGIKEMIEQSKIRLDINTIRWGEDGSETKTSTEIASVAGIASTLLIYMFLLMYGAQVMQGVMQEKTNRIVEVMISSVKPFDLMMGKIIAIGLVGLTQIAIWIVTVGGLLVAAGAFINIADMQQVTSGMAQMQPAINGGMATLPAMQNLLGGVNFTELLICFIIYFLGGYMLYASLFAAIGSAVDNESDTQQFVLPITMLIIFAFYAALYSIENPDGPLSFWCSMIPLTSPIVMMVRIPFGVPYWQLALSIAILIASFIGITWMSARIYRIGILMYGKKPSVKEMIKWLKYKN